MKTEKLQGQNKGHLIFRTVLCISSLKWVCQALALWESMIEARRLYTASLMAEHCLNIPILGGIVWYAKTNNKHFFTILTKQTFLNSSHGMRKPVNAICKQQRRRSTCASAQSDQRLCCSLPRYYNTSCFYIQNFKPLSSFCGCTCRFLSYLVANPEDRFSRDEAHF